MSERDAVDLAEHLLDHYGQCAIDPCDCIKAQWLGRTCPNWRPSGATTHAELMARARKLRAGLIEKTASGVRAAPALMERGDAQDFGRFPYTLLGRAK